MANKKQSEDIRISVYNPFRDAFSEVPVEHAKRFVQVAKKVEKKLKELGIEVE